VTFNTSLPKFLHGSGNLYRDFGYDDADARL